MIGNIAAGLYGVGVTPSTTSFESIATVSVGSGGSSYVEFTSISSGYKHLQLRFISNYNSTSWENVQMQLNGTTSSSSYASHQLQGNGSSASAYSPTTSTLTYVGAAPGSSSYANIYAVGVVDILDYTSTSKNKTIRSLNGFDANGSGNVWLQSGLYYANTNAITSIKLFSGSGSFGQYTHFALYGIKD